MGAGASIEEATAVGADRINTLFSSLVYGTSGFIDGEVLAGLIAADAEGKEFLSNPRIMALLDRSQKRSANISKEEFASFWSECLKMDGAEATDTLVLKTEAIAAKLADGSRKAAEPSATEIPDTATTTEALGGDSALDRTGAEGICLAQAQAQAAALLELKSVLAEGFDTSGWDAAKPLSEWGCGVAVNSDSGLVEKLDLGSATTAGGDATPYDLSGLTPLLTPTLRFLKLLALEAKGDLGLLASSAPELRELNLTGKGLVGDVKVLEVCPSLVRVKLRSTGVTGDVCDFAGHKRLVVLWLEDTGVTGKAGALRAALPRCDVSLGGAEEE